jgi:ubiquinone/menaquinone biosynthesis C-methylase UbiE
MQDYCRKHFYRDKSVAESYHEERFTHRRGIERDKALRIAVARALEFLPTIRTVLDLPCGTGRFTSFFCDRGLKYFGADIAREMLDVLVRDHRSKKITPMLVQSDGEMLAFKDNAFDCVVSIRLFQLIPQEVKVQVLKEMRRVSNQWLIVELMYVRSMREFGKTRYWLHKLLGRDRQFPVLDQDILDAGWVEHKRIPLKRMKNWIGIYRKGA